jgi:hypothetical protein
MDNPRERRNFPRAEINLPIQVVTGNARIPGTMQNLTIEGLAFTLEQELPIRSKVEVAINSENKKIRSNVVKIQVLRCEPQENETSPSFLISGKLIDVNDVYLNDVMTLIFGQPS